MKYFTVFLFILSIVFTSCDGRDRAYKSNQVNVENSKLSDSFFLQIKYIPQEYSEVITDTILNNGFTVRSKFYSDMNQNVLKEFKKDTIHYKHFYRENIVDLTISKNGKDIFSKLIDKDFFTSNDFSNKGKLDDSILLNLSIEGFNIENSIVVLNFDYYPEQKDRLYRYKLIVFEDGTFKVINEFVIF